MSKKLQKTGIKGGVPTKVTRELGATHIEALMKGLKDISIPRLYYQLVIFVLDGTGSMTYEGKSGKSKGEEVNDAIQKILNRIDKSKNRKSFDIGVFAFAEENKKVLAPTQLSEFDYENFNFDPTIHFPEKYRWEFLDDTLTEVKNVCDEYLTSNLEKNSQALIIMLSDGAIRYYDSALEHIEKIKRNKKIKVSSVLLEDMRWFDNDDFKQEVRSKLKSFSSPDENGHNFFASNVDPEEIRKHMIKSISTVSKVD